MFQDRPFVSLKEKRKKHFDSVLGDGKKMEQTNKNRERIGLIIIIINNDNNNNNNNNNVYL